MAGLDGGFSYGRLARLLLRAAQKQKNRRLPGPKVRLSDLCAMKKVSRPKNRRIITTYSVRCDTADSGIMFSVMDSTEFTIGGGGRGGCFAGKRPPFGFSQLSVFWIFCYRSIALMLLPVDLFHFGELCGGCIRRSGFFRQVCLWIHSTSGILPADISAVSVFRYVFMYSC